MSALIESKRKYYPALDGLRGVAILLVILHHNFRFSDYFFFGWLGVDLFFVLSGFLITDILLNDLGKPKFLKNFYLRRVLRIFPVFYLIVFACVIVFPSINIVNVDSEYYIKNQIWIWTYLQNFLFIFHEPYGDKILLHTWSLAVEEQFYLIWPLIILLIRRPKTLLVFAVGMLIFIVFSRYYIWGLKVEGLAYSSLFIFTRIDGLCIGCILALLLRVNPDYLKNFIFVVILFIAGVNFGFYFVNSKQDFNLPYLAFAGYTTFAVLFGLLVYEAVAGDLKIIQLLLNNPPLKFFGKISYGLYVYHWPVYVLLFDYTRNRLIRSNLFSTQIANLSTGIFITLIAIIISILSYHYFEKPFLRLKSKYS